MFDAWDDIATNSKLSSVYFLFLSQYANAWFNLKENEWFADMFYIPSVGSILIYEKKEVISSKFHT